MRHALIFVGIGALVILVGMWFVNRDFTSSRDTEELTISNKPAPTMTETEMFTLKSPAFESNTALASKYTCDAEDVSPPLTWEATPEGTQSFVLIMDDPDASAERWDHWVVFNIPPTTAGIGEGVEPPGVPGKNSWGRTGWGGPCPPTGTHHYSFRVYALDSMLDLPQGATKKDIETAMKEHVLGEAELLGLYQRR